MKRFFALILFSLPVFLLITGCTETKTPFENPASVDQQTLERAGYPPGNSGSIVIANRGSGSISVINTNTDEVSGTFDLPAGPNTPEPMYVVFVGQGQRVFVGDRANDRVVVFRVSDFSVETTIPVGHGAFHMWADPQGRQLWVNNDIDNTSSVVDLHTLQVITTVPTPADLVSMGGKPHDVILGPAGKLAYITVIGVSGDNDYVVQFNTRTFEETGRAAVGKDAHLSLTPRNRELYVPCQNNDAVYVLNRFSMDLIETIPIPGAHGAGMITNGKVFYTTNISGGGSEGLYAINTGNNQVIGSSDTPYPTPHNIAFPTNSKKLYLTHSGAASDKVTVYEISSRHPVPMYLGEITVGLNPFGLGYAQ